jgi:hypothetical protein
MRTIIPFRAMLCPMMATIVLTACNGQVPDKGTGARDTLDTSTTIVAADTPRVEVKVNKEYDENGNLIAYDSTYTSFRSSHLFTPEAMDSLFNAFRPGFGTRYPFLDDPLFDDLFFNDSLLYNDFFHHDFFRKRMELNEQYMDRMMQQMDSVKNHYFREGTLPPRSGTRKRVL